MLKWVSGGLTLCVILISAVIWRQKETTEAIDNLMLTIEVRDSHMNVTNNVLECHFQAGTADLTIVVKAAQFQNEAQEVFIQRFARLVAQQREMWGADDE